MYYRLEKILPNNFIKKAYSLDIIGHFGYAWNKKNVLNVVDYLTQNDYIILGGDVYKINGKIILTTCDSWYYNIDNRISCVDNINFSKNAAINYINDFYCECGDEYCFSLVVDKIL